MLNTLIMVAALGVVPNQQTQPLFPRIFPAPTGQNALEFYVRARDFAKQYDQRIVDALELQQSDSSMLQWQEKLTNRSAEIVALVKRGNQFPCVFPPSDQALGALAAIKEIAKVLMQHAQVQFAHGRPNEASDTLLTAIEMADRVAVSGASLALLVARAADAIALNAFNDNYTSIPLLAAEHILARVIVPDSGLLVKYWKSEASAVSQALEDPNGAGSDHLAYLTGFESLTRVELSTLRTRWDAAAEAGMAGMQELFSQPEDKWTEEKGRLDPKKFTADPNVLALLSGLNPKTLVETAILWRTQRRLLRVHALIAKARWENGVLPSSLSELPAEAKLDPTTGAQYAFLRLTSSAYDLYSPGNRWFGDIRLKVSSATMPRIDDGGLHEPR